MPRANPAPHGGSDATGIEGLQVEARVPENGTESTVLSGKRAGSFPPAAAGRRPSLPSSPRSSGKEMLGEGGGPSAEPAPRRGMLAEGNRPHPLTLLRAGLFFTTSWSP